MIDIPEEYKEWVYGIQDMFDKAHVERNLVAALNAERGFWWLYKKTR